MRKLAYGRQTILDEPQGDVQYNVYMAIKHDCREYCSRHHIAIPDWAKKRHWSMMRKDYLNITEEEKKRTDYRLKARQQAIAMGMPIPEWAKVRKKKKNCALVCKKEKAERAKMDASELDFRMEHFAVLTELNLSYIAQGLPQYVERASAHARKCKSDELCSLIDAGDIDGARTMVMKLINSRFNIEFGELKEKPKKKKRQVNTLDGRATSVKHVKRQETEEEKNERKNRFIWGKPNARQSEP